jgi:hypothetical protein
MFTAIPPSCGVPFSRQRLQPHEDKGRFWWPVLASQHELPALWCRDTHLYEVLVVIVSIWMMLDARFEVKHDDRDAPEGCNLPWPMLRLVGNLHHFLPAQTAMSVSCYFSSNVLHQSNVTAGHTMKSKGWSESFAF